MSYRTWFQELSTSALPEGHENVESKRALEAELAGSAAEMSQVVLSTSIVEDITNFSKEFAFRGFDIYKIRAAIIKHAKRSYPNLCNPSNSDGRIDDTKAFNKDMTKLISFAAARTMNIAKTNDLEPEKKTEINNLVIKYGILRTKSPGGIEDLTLARICAAYPHIYARALYESHKLTQFGLIDGLDLMYHMPMAPALILRTREGVKQLQAWEKWAIKFNNQINSGKDASVREQSLTATMNIAKQQWEYGYTDEERLKVLYAFYNAIKTRVTSEQMAHSIIASPSVIYESLRTQVEDKKIPRELRTNIKSVADSISTLLSAGPGGAGVLSPTGRQPPRASPPSPKSPPTNPQGAGP